MKILKGSTLSEKQLNLKMVNIQVKRTGTFHWLTHLRTPLGKFSTAWQLTLFKLGKVGEAKKFTFIRKVSW